MMNLYQLAVSPDNSSAFRWFLEMSSETSTTNSIAAPRRWSMRLNVCDEMALTKMFFPPHRRERERERKKERDACY